LAGLFVIGGSQCLAVSNGTQAGTFLLIGSGARAPAMGEAFTGLADDLTASYWNPAGLVQVSSFQASLSYTGWFAGTSYNVVSVGGALFPGHVLAATIYYFHVPRIANVPEDVEPSVDLSSYARSGSYGFRITRDLSLGAGIKLMSETIEQGDRPDSSSSSAVLDLGFMYKFHDPSVSLGIMLQNMGPKVEFRDAASPAPFWARLGVAWNAYQDEWLRVAATMDAAQPVDTGYKLVLPDGGIAEFYRLSLKHSPQNRFNYGFGTEWWIVDLVALRAGYTLRVGSDISSPSAGAGVRFKADPFVYQVDYSYSFWGDLSPNVSRVSFTIDLSPLPDEIME